MNQKKLYRSNQDKMICGICGGLGDYLGIDSTLIRLIFVFAAVFTAFIPAAIGYVIAAVIMPVEPIY